MTPTDSPGRPRGPQGDARPPLLVTGGKLELSGGGCAPVKWRRRPGDSRVGGGGAVSRALPLEPRFSPGCGPGNCHLARNWGPDAGGGVAGSGERRRGGSYSRSLGTRRGALGPRGPARRGRGGCGARRARCPVGRPRLASRPSCSRCERVWELPRPGHTPVSATVQNVPSGHHVPALICVYPSGTRCLPIGARVAVPRKER